MKKGRLAQFAILFSAIAFVDLYLFGMSCFAFAWHVRHGFHREMNGIKFSVPLFYQEERALDDNQLALVTYRSPIHSEHASITVDFLTKTSRQASLPIAGEDAESLGLVLKGQRNATLGSRAGTCLESVQSQLVLPGYSAPTLMYIECRFGDELDVRFDGSQSAVPEFYSFIESAREVSR